ncbi:unnamed protein product [Macrosiphum euphorbiae]|uniref:DDE-1 domain-containing protein n=1 Tax=Macrosiphum euphorbiae TaxID=13131 RepID=A0AAV0WQH7_9HEMI|nr:unnamed protein product [Macrosiphum euphorbiae]
MARNYKRKTEKPKSIKTLFYTKGNIIDHLRADEDKKSSTYGRPPALTIAVEENLAELLKTKEKFGYALSRKESSCREKTSVLMSCNASGEKGPPLIIFKGKSVWDKWVGEKSNFPGTTYAATENGWMEKQVGRKKSSKRKVTSGASVITSEEAVQMLREKDNEKKKRVATIQEDTERNANEIIDEVINNNLNFYDDLLLNLSVCSNEVNLLNEIERDMNWTLQENLERSEQSDWRLAFDKNIMLVKNSTSSLHNDDIDEIDRIICRLPEPSIGRRGEMVFAKSFAQYNLAK